MDRLSRWLLLPLVLLVLPVGEAFASAGHETAALALAPFLASGNNNDNNLSQQPQATTISTTATNLIVVIVLLAISSIFIKDLVKRILAGIGTFFVGMLIIAYMTPIYLSIVYETAVECEPATACAIITVNESDLQFNDKLKTVLEPLSFRHSAFINYFDELSIRMWISYQLAANDHDLVYHSLDRQNVILYYKNHYYFPVISHLGEDITVNELIPIQNLIVMNILLVGIYSILSTTLQAIARPVEEKLARTKWYSANILQTLRRKTRRIVDESMASQINRTM
jgi:hypothetical protein